MAHPTSLRELAQELISGYSKNIAPTRGPTLEDEQAMMQGKMQWGNPSAHLPSDAVERPANAEIAAALAAKGWRPEAIQWLLSTIPTRYSDTTTTIPNHPSYNTTGWGGYFDGQQIVLGRGYQGHGLEGDGGVTMAHEGTHAQDWRREMEGSRVSAEDLRALAAQEDEYPEAASIAGYKLRDSASLNDPAHWSTGLQESVGYDYRKLPPELVARSFPYVDPETSPVQPEEGWRSEMKKEKKATGPQGVPYNRATIRDPIANELFSLAMAQWNAEHPDSDIGDEMWTMHPGVSEKMGNTVSMDDLQWQVDVGPPTERVSADEGAYPGSLPNPMFDPPPDSQEQNWPADYPGQLPPPTNQYE